MRDPMLRFAASVRRPCPPSSSSTRLKRLTYDGILVLVVGGWAEDGKAEHCG
jgi:hypothetical protein